MSAFVKRQTCWRKQQANIFLWNFGRRSSGPFFGTVPSTYMSHKQSTKASWACSLSKWGKTTNVFILNNHKNLRAKSAFRKLALKQKNEFHQGTFFQKVLRKWEIKDSEIILSWHCECCQCFPGICWRVLPRGRSWPLALLTSILLLFAPEKKRESEVQPRLNFTLFLELLIRYARLSYISENWIKIKLAQKIVKIYRKKHGKI